MTKTKKLSPQARLVWDYLKSRRTLTPLIATNTLSVSSVTTRISELRRNEEVHAYLQAARLEIGAEWDKDHLGKKYRKYVLVDFGSVLG